MTSLLCFPTPLLCVLQALRSLIIVVKTTAKRLSDEKEKDKATVRRKWKDTGKLMERGAEKSRTEIR